VVAGHEDALQANLTRFFRTHMTNQFAVAFSLKLRANFVPHVPAMFAQVIVQTVPNRYPSRILTIDNQPEIRLRHAIIGGIGLVLMQALHVSPEIGSNAIIVAIKMAARRTELAQSGEKALLIGNVGSG